jgi:hypothetical protein
VRDEANKSRRRIRCIKLDNEVRCWEVRYEEMRDIHGTLRSKTFGMCGR